MSKIIEQINKLSEDGSIESVRTAEALIKKELERNPYNIELLLRFALLEQEVPLAEYEKSIIILNVVLTYEPKNPIALLILAGINYFCGHGIDKELCERLSLFETDDKEMKSMLTYAASWYYADIGNQKKLEYMLLQSIDLCPSHVFNQWKLAELLVKQNRLEEAKLLAQNAIANVVKIYDNDNDYVNYDYTSANQYINEMVKGTHISSVLYANLTELRQKITEKFSVPPAKPVD